MSITTSEKLAILSHAVERIQMKCLRGIRFDLHELSETSINLFVGPFPSRQKYLTLEIDLKNPKFQEAQSIENMQKLIFIKLAETATSISIEKNINSAITAPLFNIERISDITYAHVKDFVTELSNQQEREEFLKRIMLTLRFQLIQPTYNEEGLGAHTYIEKINPIAETLTLRFTPNVII